MYFKFKTCMGSIYDAALCSSEKEDSDYLHRLSTELNVENPARQFFRMDRNGGFKNLSIDEHNRLMAMAEKISMDYFKKENGSEPADEINVFLLLDRLFRDYIRNLEANPPDYSGSDHEDL